MLATERIGRMRWHGGFVLGIAMVAVALAGCATPTGAPRVMQPGDFKMLAGLWYGSEYIQQAQPQAIQAIVEENGVFHTALRGTPGDLRPGSMKIVNGGVVYETATSKGTMTFQESQDGKSWVWKWNGTTTDGSAVRNELTKSK
jgi:hypothetical protein